MTWKSVKGYEGLYAVNENGRVFAFKRPHCYRKAHYMTPAPDTHGYPMVCLCKNGKNTTRRVHRLVAEAFIPNPNALPEINHIDEDKTNCAAYNLEWCDHKYNINYGARTEKTCRPVSMYSCNMELIKTYPSLREACRDNDFRCPGNISNVLNGKAKTAYGYVWKEGN